MPAAEAILIPRNPNGEPRRGDPRLLAHEHGRPGPEPAVVLVDPQGNCSPTQDLAPESVKIKHYLLNLCKTRTIKYVIDFHGHGKKYLRGYLDSTLSFSAAGPINPGRPNVCFPLSWPRGTSAFVFPAALMASPRTRRPRSGPSPTV